MKRLSGARKAAILLLSMGEEAATKVLRNLSDEEIQDITREMQAFNDVSPNEVQRVASEYFLLAEKGRFLPGSPETKTAYLRRILTRAMGEDSAQRIVAGIMTSEGGGTLDTLQWHDPATIAEFVSDEHPQVIAVILAHLGDPGLSQQVLNEMPASLRDDVTERLMSIREISDEWITEIEQSLTQELGASNHTEPREPAIGGEEQVAGVLNAASPTMEQSILTQIESEHPELAARLRRQMFPFEAFLRVDNASIQKVLERTTNQDLVLALRTADEPLRRHFFRNLSPDTARQLAAAIAEFGPIRVSEIEEAQKRLSSIARELALKGELRLLERKR